MGKHIRIGLGVLLLAVPLFLAACGGDGGGGVTAVTPAPPGSALWVVPDNTFALGADNVAAVYAAAPDNLYYNVHTSVNPTGQIRGQLDNSFTVLLATLTGLQVVPQVITGAFGVGVLAIDNNAGDNSVRGFIRTVGITGTAAHIHNGARGSPGPIVLTLTGGPELWVVPDNTFSNSMAAILFFAPDNLYFDVETAAHPGPPSGAGEIRGQLDSGGLVRLATLDGAQDNVATSALGAAMLVVDNNVGGDNAVRGFIYAPGLTGTAAHIHNARRGTAGPIVIPLFGGPNLWYVSDGLRFQDNLVSIFNVAPDNLYFNVHTAAHAAGEIRGQIDNSVTAALYATLNGAQDNVVTSAFGAGVLTIDTLTGRVGGFILNSGLTGTPTVAHVHNAARGTSGPAILGLLPAP